MFKRLKEKITEEVSKSPLRLQTVQTQIGQYSPFNGAAKKPSDSQGSSESDAPTQNDGQNLIDLQENSSSIMDVNESQQFSIADEDGASSATVSPIPQPQFQRFENVELTTSPMPGSAIRPRTSSVSSTGSQPSFFPVYSPMQSSYSIQSDLESTSEMEDAGVNLDIISKEQLYQAFQKAKAKYARYKARYSDVVKAYREQVNEKEKIKSILTESQDKALRRISELREQSQLEQKAKAHLEDSFRVTLEEKDDLLKVLQTQIRLLKNGEDPTEKETCVDTQNHLIDISSDSVKADNEETSDENTQLKIKTYEETIVKLKSLLKNCKDTIVKHRENNIRLAAEKDQLTEKLNEANAQLNHFMEEKSEKDKDLLNELMQASQTIENFKTKEAEDALSMAETKRLMHEEMEGKEKKLQELMAELQQLYVDKEELQNSVEEKSRKISEIELKCKNDVESAKQRLEEAEKMLEDEKQNLLHELSRGKAAAIQLMQQEADKRLKEMEDEKSSALQSLELEWEAKMQQKVREEIEKLVEQDALESTITMSDHFTNQIATLKREVQEKELQLKRLVEEKTLFQEQVQEQCGRQAAMESEIAQMMLEKLALQAEYRRLQTSSIAHPLLAVKDVMSVQLNELRNWVTAMKLDIAEAINVSSERFTEVNSEVSRLSQAHESELEPLVGTIESLKLENEKYAEENGRFKDDFDTAQQKIAQLEDRCGAVELQLNVRETALKETKDRLAVVSEHLRQLEHEREAAFEELATLKLLRDDLDVVNARCERSGSEIVVLRDELAAKDAEIFALAARYDQLAEALRADVLARDFKISDLETELNKHRQNSCDELNLQKQSMELEVKELQDAVDASASRHAAEIESVNERLRIEVERNEALLKMHTTMSVAPMESIALQCHLDAEPAPAGLEHGTQLLEVNRQLALELDNMKNVTETLRGEVDSLREQLNASKAQYEQHIGELRSQIEAKQSELEGLEVLHIGLEARIGELEEEIANTPLEDLQQNCVGLEQEKKMLSERLAEREVALRQLEEEREDLTAKLAENCGLVQQLEIEKTDLVAKVGIFEQEEEEKSDLSSRLAEKAALLLRLEEENYERSVELAKNVEILHRAEEEKNRLSAQQAESDALVHNLEEEMRGQGMQLSEYVALSHQAEEEKNNLSAQLAESIAVVQKLEEEKNNVRVELEETLALVRRLEEQLAASGATEEDLSKLQSDMVTLQSDWEKCQENLLAKTGLSEELAVKVASLESEAAQKAALAQSHEDEAIRLRALVSWHETQTRTLSEELERLETAASELRETNASQRRTVWELTEQLQLAEAAQEQHAEELRAMERERECNNGSLRINLGDLEEKVKNVELDYVCLRSKTTSQLTAAKDEFEFAKAEVEKLKGALEEAVGSCHAAEEESRSLAQEIWGFKASISTLQGTIKSRDQELDDLRREASRTEVDHQQLVAAAEQTADECRELKAALDQALAQKTSVEKELTEQRHQADLRDAEFQAQAQDVALMTEALREQKEDLEKMVLDERKEHEVLMQQRLQQVNEENQSKLADLRKRAENKLAQIKKQLVFDADKAKEEMQTMIARLEEQRKLDDEIYSEKLVKQRDNVAQEFQDRIEGLEQSLSELQTALENERSSWSEEKEVLLAEITLKNAQIDESLLNAQENHVELAQRITNLQTQLEQAEAGLKQSEIELVELRRQLAEKEELAQLLEAQLPTETGSSEYERILECKDEEHAIKIKQLVREFSVMIAQIEEDGRQALSKAIETSTDEDNRLRREHAVHLNEIQNEFGAKELSFEMVLEEKEGIIQARSEELTNCSRAYEEKMDLMKTEHQRQMQELEKKWKAMLRKELKQQAAMHEEDVNGLTQEWQLERKELQQQTHLASSAIESGGQSSELLRRQIMTMQTQMEMLKDRHKAEVSELHQILQASNCPVPSGKSAGIGIFRDRPALQSLEIEYLKNILFEYMMGRETLTLAKVIATVVQFSDEQLNKILEKEESRGGGVSGQLGQIWK